MISTGQECLHWMHELEACLLDQELKPYYQYIEGEIRTISFYIIIWKETSVSLVVLLSPIGMLIVQCSYNVHTTTY